LVGLATGGEDKGSWVGFAAGIFGIWRTSCAVVATFELAGTAAAIAIDRITIVAGQDESLTVSADFGA
jgi:hypothetical protein